MGKISLMLTNNFDSSYFFKIVEKQIKGHNSRRCTLENYDYHHCRDDKLKQTVSLLHTKQSLPEHFLFLFRVRFGVAQMHCLEEVDVDLSQLLL